MFNDLSQVCQLKNQHSNSEDLEPHMQGTFHIRLKDMSVLEAHLVLTYWHGIQLSNWGQQEMFIYVQVHGKSISIQLFKKIITNKKILLNTFILYTQNTSFTLLLSLWITS